MRYIKYGFYAALMVVLILLALANREWVTLNLLPEGMREVLPLSIQLPLFMVIFLSIAAGLLLGYVLEYFREHKHRRLASRKSHEAAELAREVEVLKKRSGQEEDDILALLK